MRRSGVLIATAALSAALVANESAEVAKTGGIYPWYRYGYGFPPPYEAEPPAFGYIVTGRSVATGPFYNYSPVYGYKVYCAYGYDYPFGCPFLGWPDGTPQ
jgi:hypothetical protein